MLGAQQNAHIGKLALTGAAGIPPKRTGTPSFRLNLYKTIREGLRGIGAGTLANRLAAWYSQRYGSADYLLTSGVMRETFLKVVNEDLTPFAQQVSRPTLLLWGEGDQDTPLWQGQLLEQLIPDAGLIIYKNGDHYAHILIKTRSPVPSITSSKLNEPHYERGLCHDQFPAHSADDPLDQRRKSTSIDKRGFIKLKNTWVCVIYAGYWQRGALVAQLRGRRMVYRQYHDFRTGRVVGESAARPFRYTGGGCRHHLRQVRPKSRRNSARHPPRPSPTGSRLCSGDNDGSRVVFLAHYHRAAGSSAKSHFIGVRFHHFHCCTARLTARQSSALSSRGSFAHPLYPARPHHP